MLTPDQIEALRLQSEDIIDPVVRFLIGDIAQRISEAGHLTSTAAYQVWRLQHLGVSQRQLKKELRKLLKVSHRELRKLMTQTAEVGYNYDIQRFPYVQAVPFERNEDMQRIVEAAVKLAEEDLGSLTQTLGFVAPNGKAMPLTDAYREACDFAFKKVFTGAQDYNSAVREATKGLVEKGILRLDYDSGVHRSVEAAVRGSVMGGLGLLQEQISQQNHDDFGCDGWEISAHANSAPDHEPIQGKQYSDEEYERLNNSLKRQIGTLNCGHSAFPILLGIHEPQYTPEELEKFREDNEKGITYNGKHYTMYEATQRQRLLERKIRKLKRRILVDEKLGDTEQLSIDRTKYVVTNDEYRRFSKAAGLRIRHERMEMTGFGPKQHGAAEKSSKEAEVVRKTIEASRKVKSSTPATSATSTSSSRNYADITGAWYPEAVPNSHTVQELQSVTVNGVTYQVDGRNVVLDYSEHEKEIAELLEREVGGEIYMVPRVNNPQGISTPDYLFHGKGYDLKTIGKTTGKNPILNRVKKAKGQARCFIIDISKSELTEAVVEQQIDKIFWSKDTQFVDELVIIHDGKIVRVIKRA